MAPGSEMQRRAKGAQASRLCVAALALVTGACASQRQNGQLLAATGTVAAITGAVVLSRASCPAPYPPEFYQGSSGQYRCSPNRSGQTLGTAVAAAGLGAASLGYALEAEANRLDAWKRRAPTKSAPSSPTQAPFTLALPEPAFATPSAPIGGSGNLAGPICQCPSGALAECIEPSAAEPAEPTTGHAPRSPAAVPSPLAPGTASPCTCTCTLRSPPARAPEPNE